MPDSTPTVAAAEISRLAGVTRATVSNWRRRHPDFPAPVPGGSESRPLFNLREVQEWLRGHGVTTADSPVQRLRTLLRSEVEPDEVVELMNFVATPKVAAKGPVQQAVRDAIAATSVRDTLTVLAERGLDGPSTGIYPTDEPVAALMADVLAASTSPAPNSVLDPSCGGGALLLEAARIGAKQLAGQDILPVQASRTSALLATAAPKAKTDIHAADALLADAFEDVEFDAVLANPPYSQRDWGADELALDPRWVYSVPPRGESELAWVQHALAHLVPGGTAVLLLPPAVAARSSGRRIRMELLRAGALRAVIALPAGASTPRQVGLQLWVLRKPGVAPPADTILFVDTTRMPTHGADQPDWPQLAEQVVDAWRAFDKGDIDTATVADITAVVRVMDLLDDDVDLTPARQVRAAIDPENASSLARAAIVMLDEHLSGLHEVSDAVREWDPAPGAPWRYVAVGNLIAGKAVRIVTGTENIDNGAQRAVLTGHDLLASRSPSGLSAPGAAVGEVIEAGDVLVSRIRDDHGAAQGARVAEGADVGAVAAPGVLVFRTDPDRLDPWFFAGFIGSPDNAAAMYGTTTIRLDPTRLRIPLLPPSEQQRYGEAFRRLHQLRVAARTAADAARTAADLIGTGLTAGALQPVREGVNA
ncbi:N-6 DNA methylase [Nocardia camponoti]|uniref:Type II restriction endonuclease subunit M n=1 Tax=Nocardia camponoti TaxID=1616106 RepID=A0A917QDG3_9NOCA|nr:N-6 DNA methylase [Nocardia camponoti]GGK46110.1 type II restriction endonuclease subunit M [Nocardia camponoti]